MGPIAVAAYSYMALVPIIQPPIMKLFEIAAAALSLKPKKIAPKYAAKIPNCAAAPSRKLLLLVPIAFGMLLVNIYPDIMAPVGEGGAGGGLLYYFYLLDVPVHPAVISGLAADNSSLVQCCQQRACFHSIAYRYINTCYRYRWKKS